MHQAAGPMSGIRASAAGRKCSSYVFGAMKSRGAPAPADQHERTDVRKSEEREGRTPLDRPPPAARQGLARTPKFPIEREVVSGHAYAILAPEARTPGWCGYDKPTFLSVDGVSDP